MLHWPRNTGEFQTLQREFKTILWHLGFCLLRPALGAISILSKANPGFPC